MKNIFVGTFIAVALFATPLYPTYAQVASSTEEQVASLRVELIQLLMMLIAQLQEQLDTQMVKDQAQDVEIETIKTRTSTRSIELVAQVEELPVDDIEAIRKRVGVARASAGIQQEDDAVTFDLTNYLDTDIVSVSANMEASSTEDIGCTQAISGTTHTLCAQYATYPIPTGEARLIITVTVNGKTEEMVLTERWKNATVSF